MSRVLITGGAGTIGATVAKRLLADPTYDVRVSDEHAAPQWMREGCEIRSADLRSPEQARAAVQGCSHVIHLASAPLPDSTAASLAHTLLEYETALHSAIVRAALDCEVQRLLYVSSPLVFERAELFPTPEEHLAQCPVALSSAGYGRLTGERFCRAAHDEHGLPFTICRPFATYGPDPLAYEQPGVSKVLGDLFEAALGASRPLKLAAAGEQTLTPTHVEDVAHAIVTALASPAALDEDFNIAAAQELNVADAAAVIWRACDEPDDDLSLEQTGGDPGEAQRSHPSVDKARELLGWQAQTTFADGAAGVVAARRDRDARGRGAGRPVGSAV
jgi:UDP-glucose 4-epimerase